MLEAGIEQLVSQDLEHLGARSRSVEKATKGAAKSTNYATETWAPEEWLRKLKTALIEPKKFLTPAEEAFWRTIIEDPKRYWLAGSSSGPSQEAQERLGPHVLGIGVPNEGAIEKAWERFKEEQGPEVYLLP